LDKQHNKQQLGIELARTLGMQGWKKESDKKA
jgi:hypothetical protein